MTSKEAYNSLSADLEAEAIPPGFIAAIFAALAQIFGSFCPRPPTPPPTPATLKQVAAQGLQDYQAGVNSYERFHLRRHLRQQTGLRFFDPMLYKIEGATWKIGASKDEPTIAQFQSVWETEPKSEE